MRRGEGVNHPQDAPGLAALRVLRRLAHPGKRRFRVFSRDPAKQRVRALLAFAASNRLAHRHAVFPCAAHHFEAAHALFALCRRRYAQHIFAAVPPPRAVFPIDRPAFFQRRKRRKIKPVHPFVPPSLFVVPFIVPALCRPAASMAFFR